MLVFIVFLACFSVVFAEDDQTFAVKFLNKYQYISPSRSGNHDVPAAIKRFQEFYSLPVTGELDDSTISLMKKPRCGMPDVDENGRKRRYVTMSKWEKTALNYYIEYGADLDQATQDADFKKALQFWADQSTLTFSQVYSGADADIKISFGQYAHKGTHVESTCPYPFDGRGGTLAHAYFPQDGRAHFDEAETYTSSSAEGTNLLWVATHEFGHSLGLGHTNIKGAVMFPYYTGYTPDMKLHYDDIAGIQSLYGSNPNPGATDAPNTNAPGTSSPDCKDRLNNCHHYDDPAYCAANEASTRYWCAKSCKFC